MEWTDPTLYVIFIVFFLFLFLYVFRCSFFFANEFFLFNKETASLISFYCLFSIEICGNWIAFFKIF